MYQEQFDEDELALLLRALEYYTPAVVELEVDESLDDVHQLQQKLQDAYDTYG